MPASVSIPSRTYQPGTHSATIPNLSGDEVGIDCIFTRENWPDGSSIITAIVEYSNDNWVTKFELARTTFDGGVQINSRTGQTVTQEVFRVYWPERSVDGVLTPQRPTSVRGTAINTVAITTAISINGF